MSCTFRKTNDSVNDSRRGLSLIAVLISLVSVTLVAGGIFYFGFRQKDDRVAIQPILAPVEVSDFVSQVLDQGEVQSSENVEIRCQVRARNGAVNVISLVPEGSIVNPGDFLVRLDSTSFEKELETQKVAVANAETGVIQAEAALAAAQATLKEYKQGVFVEKRQTIQNEIFDAKTAIETARQEETQAIATLDHSRKLQKKGFITNQQLEADTYSVARAKLSVQKGENSLALALQKLKVLEEITYEKEVNTLESDIRAAEVKLKNQQEAFKVEQNQEKEIEEQIKNCEVRVPEGVEGQVVYGKESSRGGNEWVLEEGASVRENQVMIRLPNPEKMEIKALINEQSITRIRKDMPVSIKVDALNNQVLRGIVTKVNQYAESSGWMSSSVRKYRVIVKIIDPPEALKPGMNASCSIQVESQDGVLTAPIQTVYAVGNRQFCLVKKGDNDWETREVEVADDNSQVVWIKGGVQEGEELVMNPGAYTEYMDLPEQNLDEKIELSEEERAKIAAETKAEEAKEKKSGGQDGGRGGFSMPESGKALVAQKDQDADGKLTKDEVGSPFSFFFDRVDGDKDGFLSVEELDKSIQMMKRMRANGGMGGGGMGGGGGRRGGGFGGGGN